jgi:hypothetical protein
MHLSAYPEGSSVPLLQWQETRHFPKSVNELNKILSFSTLAFGRRTVFLRLFSRKFLNQ